MPTNTYFDGQKDYWYRTNYRGYRVGDAVIVPITNNCKWGKGTITRIEKYTADKVPFPLDKTKGIVSKFGFFGESKIVPDGKNHFRWYMNLDGKNTTALDMVTEGRKSHAVISFNEDEEGEPPLHNGTVVWFKDIASLFANQLQNVGDYAIINEQSNEVDEKKSSILTILHRRPSATNTDRIRGNHRVINTRAHSYKTVCPLFFCGAIAYIKEI